LIAALAPKPDVVASVRKLPLPAAMIDQSEPPAAGLFDCTRTVAGSISLPVDAPPEPSAAQAGDPPGCASTRRPIVKALAPERYRVQFTIGQETHDKLRRVQALLRREVPNGDAGVIFERALDLLLEKVEKAKLGVPAKATSRRAPARPGGGAYETRIRFETDKGARERPPSRHIPNAVKRAVWTRDRGQCAFVSATGRRCSERNFLEIHHIQPYALEGPATVGNLSLRCRRHNQYEAELIFGPREPLAVKETGESYRMGSAVP
jgi:hypothetical protein